MENLNPKARRKARMFAIQALYQQQFNDLSIADLQQQFLVENPEIKADWAFFQKITREVLTHLTELDELFMPHLTRTTEEVNPVEKSILRLGTTELKHHPETPYKVVINEYVELAKSFGAEAGHKFVNSVLDKVTEHVRSVEKTHNQK